MIRLARYLIALAIVAAAPAYAAEQWYEVELIVFRQQVPSGTDAELPPATVTPPTAEQVVSLRRDAGAGTPYAMLDSSQLQLGGIYQTLQKSNYYQPLLHIGWRQPAYGMKQTASVAIPADWQPWNDAVPPLYGLVRVYRERFVHAAVDLRYRLPGAVATTTVTGSVDTSDGSVTDGSVTYTHQQSRRIRNTGELHYLDHPVLGVLVQVRPIEQ